MHIQIQRSLVGTYINVPFQSNTNYKSKEKKHFNILYKDTNHEHTFIDTYINCMLNLHWECMGCPTRYRKQKCKPI